MVFDHEEDVDKPFHHRDVHIAVALIAIAAATIVGSVPIMMFAQESAMPALPPIVAPQVVAPQQPQQPQQPAFDMSACINHCNVLKQNCVSLNPPTDTTAAARCDQAVADCITQCNQAGTTPQQGLLQPGQGTFQPGQMPPQGGFQPGQMPPQGGYPGSGPNQGQGFNPGSGVNGNGPGGGQGFGGGPGGPGGGPGFGGPGGMMGGPGQQGPSEEEIKKMQEQGLKQMKKGVAGFAKQLVNIKKRVAALEKKGISAPTELKDALAKADEAVQAIQAADSFDTASDPAQTLQDVGQIIQDQMPIMERLANLPTIYKRIDNEIKKLDRYLASDKSLAARSKVDLTSAVDDFEKSLNDLKSAYDQAKQKISAGDVEDGFNMLEDTVYGAISDANQNHAAITQIRQLATTIKQMTTDISRSQTILNSLKKKGDITKAQAIINDAKDKLDELKTEAAAKPFDANAGFDLIGQITDLRDQFNEEVNNIRGIETPNNIDAGIKQLPLSVPDFQSLPGFGPGQGPAGGFGQQPGQGFGGPVPAPNPPPGF